MADLRAAFPQIRIFPAVELSDGSESQHLLALGATDPVYLHLAGAGLWENVLDLARRQGCLTVLAHPFRFTGGHALLDQGLRPDAIEHLTGNHDEMMAELTHALADEHRLAMVNAGDLHSVKMADRFWIETERDVLAACDIRPIVLESAYTNVAGV